MPTAELILDAHALVGEGPVWLAESGELLWVDIESNRCTGSIRRPPVTARSTSARMSARCSPTARAAWSWRCRPASRGCAPARRRPSRVALNDDPGIRLNDAKVDPRGRIFVGSMSYAETPARGNSGASTPTCP